MVGNGEMAFGLKLLGWVTDGLELFTTKTGITFTSTYGGNLSPNIYSKGAMKNKLFLVTAFFIGSFLLNTKVSAQDPNFYIYICFGQSNM